MKQITPQYMTEIGTTANGQPVITLYKNFGKWDNGDLFELSEKQHIKDFYSDQYDGKDRDVNAEILHEIKLNDWSRWNKELPKGQKVEINENTYYDLLNCLPPHYCQNSYFEVGEAHHHDNTGKAIYRACWVEDGKYYTGYPRQK